MLTTLAAIRLIPTSPAPNPVWLNALLSSADAAIKSWCKRDLEQTTYPGNAVSGQGDAGYYSGINETDIVLRQYPVWNPATIVASGSNRVALPTGTINVASTTGFPTSGPLCVNLATGSPQSTAVTYTGLTSTSFTGCTGGTGTLATGQGVSSILCYYDPQGYFGQRPTSFPSNTLLTPGYGFMLVTNRFQNGAPVSGGGLLRRIGAQGYGLGFPWGLGGSLYSDKMSAQRKPCWPQGEGVVKVAYTAGYNPIPPDLAYACQMMVEYMVRNLPYGGMLQEEHIGAYGYSLIKQAQKGGIPELGSLAITLGRYRDSSLGAIS